MTDRGGAWAVAVALGVGTAPAAATLAVPPPTTLSVPPPPVVAAPPAASPGFAGGSESTLQRRPGLAAALTPLTPVDSADTQRAANPFAAAATRARTSLLAAMTMVLGEPLIQLAFAAGIGVTGLAAFRRHRRRPW